MMICRVWGKKKRATETKENELIPSMVVPVNAVQSDNDNTDGKGESNLKKKQQNLQGDRSHNHNDIKPIDKPTVTERAIETKETTNVSTSKEKVQESSNIEENGCKQQIGQEQEDTSQQDFSSSSTNLPTEIIEQKGVHLVVDFKTDQLSQAVEKADDAPAENPSYSFASSLFFSTEKPDLVTISKKKSSTFCGHETDLFFPNFFLDSGQSIRIKLTESDKHPTPVPVAVSRQEGFSCKNE
ncbi:hypothetical protein H5410_050561 [Solanum commersonii]|uniref:Uncharacterized protein n=1 Tax=Solanum commersonii TaxID=4109 RepID=A0A9J5WY93_SOLCO|nr:hypothetical protein H5410_050561 [Solanum commersonii]